MFRKSSAAQRKTVEETVEKTAERTAEQHTYSPSSTPSKIEKTGSPARKTEKSESSTILSRKLEDQCNSGQVVWIAGPAYVYSVDQVLSVAGELSSSGVKFLRSRAYWPQAQPRDFARHLETGLKVLYAAAKHYSMQVVSEIVDSKHLEIMNRYCDVLEVRPENATDVRLLRDLSLLNKTVIFNRHPMMSIERYLTMVRILELGRRCKVVLAESGMREGQSAFPECGCSLSSLVRLRRKTSHPILFDATSCIDSGREMVLFSATAIAAGADGIIAEIASKHQPQKTADGKVNQLAVWQLQRAMKNTTALKYTLAALRLHERSED